jgi:hypothetical protein
MDGYVDDKHFFKKSNQLPFPFFIEVITQLGDTALLDGDALLSCCLLPTYAGVDLAHGGQMLHLLEVVERFLFRLRRFV